MATSSSCGVEVGCSDIVVWYQRIQWCAHGGLVVRRFSVDRALALVRRP